MIGFITNVLGNPTIMLGLIALIGLLILKKPFSETMLGVIKTMMGYLILSAGTTIIATPISLLTTLVQKGLGVQGVLPLYWIVYGTSMEQFGTQAALMFVIGFAINILLARFTPWKNLALTVHLQLFWTAFMASIMGAYGFSGPSMILIGGLISGVYFWISTTISAKLIKPYTEAHANFVPSAVPLAIACCLGDALFKGEQRSTEDIKLPKSFSWLKDSIIACAVAVFLLNIIFTVIAGTSTVAELSNGTPWLVYDLIQALTFGGGIAVILYGVRMMLAELIPAFTGIAETILPDSVLGLDYPTAFGYAGTGLMIGFVFNLLGSIVACIIMAATGFSPCVLPGVQINFFEGGLIGVYANAHGGYKSCILGSFITGFLLQFLVAITFPLTGSALIATNGAYEAMDFNSIGYILAKLFAAFGH